MTCQAGTSAIKDNARVTFQLVVGLVPNHQNTIPKGEIVTLVYSLGTEDTKKKIHIEKQAVLSCSPRLSLLAQVPRTTRLTAVGRALPTRAWALPGRDICLILCPVVIAS